MNTALKYGVSLYSYTDDLTTVMNLEDAFDAISDLGATGIEILGEAHVPGYPAPSAAWIDRWFSLLEQFRLEPTNYGSWIDTRLHHARSMTAREGAEDLARDIRIASQLGFRYVRPKIGVVSFDLVPDPIWEEAVERCLDLAHQSNVIICPEIHAPTPIRHPVVDAYIAFIERTGTSNFGLLIDTGIFQDRPLPYFPGETPEMRRDFLDGIKVPPADFLAIAKYVVFIQAKFHSITDALVDENIPWEAIIPVLKQAGYAGYISSEYEGDRAPWRAVEQVRRQHALIREIEREYDAKT
ncbi:sugar phosphate isomerase/epimerase family protein [Massilia sp. LjRoot122]|uniref:sugar phosphate isomerase/epimerase family protein n=1 Tax=Massilia sp. LjRoot122 TaxID=3342257 RepID=UPI003ECF3856